MRQLLSFQMKFFIQNVDHFVFTGLLIIAFSAPVLYAGSTGEWDDLNKAVQTRKSELQKWIATAQDKALATDQAEVTVQVISMFQAAAKQDRQDPEHVRKVFSKFERPKQVAPDAVERLPYNQLNACLNIADHAIDELKRQLAGDVTLTPSPDLMRPGMKSNGRGQYELNGRVVFPSSLIWPPNDLDFKRALGSLGGSFSQISQLIQRGGGTYAPNVLQGHISSVSRQSINHLSPIVFHTGHKAADWMVKNNPEILGGARNFTQYDIDSPQVRGWISSMYRQILPGLSEAAGDVPMIHLLGNEPHFSIRERGWKANNQLSEITLKKYKKWVQDKYGSIATVNKLYRTGYQSFDELDTTNPISTGLRGGPAWYDWCRFNMDRVNEWFAFLKHEVQAHDGVGHPVTIKLLGHALEELNSSHGIDIEYLTKLQDINGADLRVTPSDAVFHGRHEQGLDPKTSWRSRYSTEWLSQSIFLDFTKSLRPNTIFYDSEWHGFSTVSWRDFTIDREYVRSALWLAYSHGMSMTNAWLWGRDANGRLRSSANHYGELSTQPIAVDAYGRVFKELNAHGELVAATVPRHRRFRVYFTQESAIQSEAYTGHLCDVYEALKLRNYAVGFTTPTEIQKLDPSDHIVIATPAEFISDESLSRLKDFEAAGGRIVLISKQNNYSKNELGQLRHKRPGLIGFATIPMSGVLDLTRDFAKKLDPHRIEMPLGFRTIAGNGDEMYGVFVQSFKDHDSGDIFALVNSQSKESGVLTVTMNNSKNIKLLDVLTQREFGSSLPIDSRSVYFLKIIEK